MNHTTIANVLSTLVEQARHCRTRSLMTRRLAIRSADPHLVEFVDHMLDVWGADDLPRDAPCDACLITYSEAIPNWRDWLEGAARRVVDTQDGFRTEVFEIPSGTVTVQEGLGILLIGNGGEIVCAVDEHEGKRGSHQMRDFNSLIQTLVAYVLGRDNWLLVHAGGVGHEGKCRAVTGLSGSGKTTEVLRLVSMGDTFYGDDQLILRRDEKGDWRVWPYWRYVSVTSETCRLLPQLSKFADSIAPGRKRNLEIRDIFPVMPPPPALLESIHCLSDREDAPRRLTHEAAVEQVAPCFLYYCRASDAARMLDDLCDVVERVPVFLTPRSWFDSNSDCAGARE